MLILFTILGRCVLVVFVIAAASMAESHVWAAQLRGVLLLAAVAVLWNPNRLFAWFADQRWRENWRRW